MIRTTASPADRMGEHMAQVVMVVDENQHRALDMQNHIEQELGLDSYHLQSGEDAIRTIVGKALPQPDVVLFYMDGDRFSLDTIRAMRNFRTDVQVVALVSHAQEDIAEQVMQGGAADVLFVPFHPVQLTMAIRNALLRRDLQIEARHAWASEHLALEDVDAKSAALQGTIFLAKKLAKNDAPLVLEGAPGTGREMIARAIHGSSSRGKAAFVPLNASVLLADEAEHVLFGNAYQEGVLDKVQNGTLFLRNLDSLPTFALHRLKAIIQDGAPICESRPKHVFSGRIMFAMNDAARRASSKEAQEISRLFSSLNAMSVNLPYLRDIPEDIETLAWLYCRRYAVLEGKTITRLSAPAVQMLREISWPGNMEQLSQGIFNAVMCCQGSELLSSDFRYLFRTHSATVSSFPSDGRGEAALPQEGLQSRLDGLLKCVDDTGNVKRLQEVEEEIIRYALKRYSGHMSDVARHLGIGRSTLYRKLSSMDGE